VISVQIPITGIFLYEAILLKTAEVVTSILSSRWNHNKL